MNALFHGSIAKIQKMTGYSRTTISEALNHDTTGKKDKTKDLWKQRPYTLKWIASMTM